MVKSHKRVKKWSIQENRADCENFAACEILHAAKISTMLTLPSYLAPISIYFVHVASSLARVFSHLNWLEDSGTIGLQNYKNIHMISSIVGTSVYQLGYLS